MDFPRPIVTVDVALFSLDGDELTAALLPRPSAPFAGQPALPGGFVHVDSDGDAEAAARRILKEKCALVPPWLEQLYTFSGAGRDPRGWSVSIAWFALVPEAALAGADRGLFRCPVDRLPTLPFDHGVIIARAVERLRAKAMYSALPAYLLPEPFTMAELHQVYERVQGQGLDKAGFRRKIEDQGIVEPIPGQRRIGAHRPAQLYRLKPGMRPEFDRRI